MKNLIIVLYLTTFMSALLFSQQPDSTELSSFFKGLNGAMVIYDKSNNKYIRYNTVRCSERFLPASTFKIPNSLIGLETGVIPDLNYVIKWDGKPQFLKEWERDHTLKSAIFYSVVPYYQELARRVGKERMQHWLDTIDYGNKAIGNKIDRFWLDNSLKISADEQIEFLKNFYDYKLPFSKRSVDIVKDILPKEVYGKATLKFKTGTGTKEDKTYIAWLVGYVEKSGNVYFFAFNVDDNDFDTAAGIRNKLPREILKNLGILE